MSVTSIVERIPTTPLLRPDQIEEMHEEESRLERLVRAPSTSPERSQDPGAARRQLQNLRKQLQTQSPASHAPTTATEKDELASFIRTGLAEVTTGMLTEVEMRRNPPGAVDRHLRWEKANKQKTILIKNALRMLNPDNTDQDLANLERYRKPGQVTGAMVDAQIPGVFTMPANLDQVNFQDGYLPAVQTVTVGEGHTVTTPLPPPAPGLTCPNCGGAVPDGRKWCSNQCRGQAYSRRNLERMKAKKGRAAEG